jgi:hypothetical protein
MRQRLFGGRRSLSNRIQVRPLFAPKSDPSDGAKTGVAEPHRAEQSRSWRAVSREVGYARFLKRQLSLPVSMMSQWCVSRSCMAVVILASPNTCGQSAKARYARRSRGRRFRLVDARRDRPHPHGFGRERSHQSTRVWSIRGAARRNQRSSWTASLGLRRALLCGIRK